MLPVVAEGLWELVASLVRSGFGWRLLLSPSYRAASQDRWDTSSLAFGAELAAAALGIGTSLVVAGWLVLRALR